MQAGFFETDITPPIGAERPGYGKRCLSGIHDPLKVRAAVFAANDQRVALIGVDASYLGFDSVVEAKKRIIELTSIQPDNICIGASHTHSGAAATAMFQMSSLDTLPPEIYDLAVEHSACPSPGYREWVVEQIASAVYEADKHKEDALISNGSGYEDSMIFNRRFKMKNGRVYTHPGKLNPDIVEVAGPVDPEVGVTGAWRRDGSLIGCVVNYACHATCDSSPVASADWVHYLQLTIRRMMGQDCGVVFLNGACGDVTQVNNLANTVDGGQEIAKKLGTRVGAEAVKVLTCSAREEFREIAAETTGLTLKRRKPAPDSLKKCWKIVRDAGEDDNSPEYIFAKERILADYLCKTEPEITIPVGAVKIGNAVYLSNPAEYFCQLGLDIKAESPFDYTFIVSLANGSLGYVPNAECFGAAGGGYETVLTSYSNMEVQAGEKIRFASIALAKQLVPEKAPPPPKSKSWQAPWSYGILGPDVT